MNNQDRKALIDALNKGAHILKHRNLCHDAVKKDYGLQYLLSEVTAEDQNAFVAKAKAVIQSAGHEF